MIIDADLVFSSWSVSAFSRFIPTILHHISAGDVADDRFFHKTNDSDATQFSLLYPAIGPHGIFILFISANAQKVEGFGLVWATFWIIFQLVFLAGFATLGIYAFKVPISY